MSQQAEKSESKRDWRISVTLGAVWCIALVIMWRSGIEIPGSMLLMATVFFILLIPAMNDLVRSIERYSSGRPDSSERQQ